MLFLERENPIILSGTIGFSPYGVAKLKGFHSRHIDTVLVYNTGGKMTVIGVALHARGGMTELSL